jgi:hypothetical protein
MSARKTVTLGGVPQLVYEVHLENRPEDDIDGIALGDLLDRIIIAHHSTPGQYMGRSSRNLQTAASQTL